MSSKVQLSGGAFQDPAGNPLVNGYLLFSLSQDGLVNGSSQIAAGREIKVILDSSGNVVSSPAQYIWPNDVIVPANTFYTVSGYTSAGQLVWGPNSQQVLSSPSPYNITVWVPSSVNLLEGNVTTYDIGLFFPGQYVASQVILLLPIERAVTFAPNFVPSVAACGVNPASSTVFSIRKNNVQAATLSFATNGVATFVSASGAAFNPGDVLTIVGQATPDLTLANVGITLSGDVL
jgi:hypothetical protein